MIGQYISDFLALIGYIVVGAIALMLFMIVLGTGLNFVVYTTIVAYFRAKSYWHKMDSSVESDVSTRKEQGNGRTKSEGPAHTQR